MNTAVVAFITSWLLLGSNPPASATGLLSPNLENLLENTGDWTQEYPLCRNNLNEFRKGIEAKERWALQMLDASTKVPSGLLTGNLIDYGNFDECVHSEKAGRPFSPWHCMASFNLTNVTDPNMDIPVVLSWSYCIPESCPPEVLSTLLSEFLPNATVYPTDCQNGRRRSLHFEEFMGAWITGMIPLIAIASTVYEISALVLKSAPNPWLTSFSIYSNCRRLLNTEISSETLTPLHGLRFLSISWIILGHRIYFSSMVPVMNKIDMYEEFRNVSFQIFAGGVLAVDTFFLLSGLLNSYLLLKLLNTTKKFPIGTFYVHRYLRTTPALAAVVLMYACWYTLLDDGPGWFRMTFYSKELCLEYWWSTLLYINNYYNPIQQCVGHSWYLAVDMQLYWLSPLIILPIWRWPRITKYYLGFLLLVSTTIQFLVALIMKFRMAFTVSLNVEENLRLTKHLYVPTHTRATPYIIGIMLGSYLESQRNALEKPKFSKVQVLYGWVLSTALCLTVIFGNYPLFQSEQDHSYKPVESTTYIALHRIAWGAGISWIIAACHFGYGGIINSILSSRVFIPLSRLTYCIFLLHLAVQQYLLGTMRSTSYYRVFSEVHSCFGDLVMSVIAALFLHLLVEAPFAVLEGLILKRRRQKPKVELRSYTNNAFQET